MLVRAESTFDADTTAALSSAGAAPVDITHASQSKIALDLLADGQFDGILCSDGPLGEPLAEFVAAVRERTRTLPIIILTTNPEPPEVADAVDAGVTDCFPLVGDPTHFELVLDSIREANPDAESVNRTDQSRNSPESRVENISEDTADVSYAKLVEESKDGIAIVRDEVYEFVNSRFAELTGYDRGGLIGSPVQTVIVPEDWDLVRNRDESQSERARSSGRYDIELETADGDCIAVELTVSEIALDGEPATLVNARDSDVRRRLEEQIRDRERRLRVIAKHVDQIIYLTDEKLTEVRYVNAAYEEIFDRSRATLYENPMSFMEGVHPDDREGLTEFVERMVEDFVSGAYDDVSI